MPLSLPIVNGYIVPLPTSNRCIHGLSMDTQEMCDICSYIVQRYRAENQCGSSDAQQSSGLVHVPVEGDVLPVALWQFEQSASVLLAEEQEKAAPDNALIGFICNAVRLAREHAQQATRPTDIHDPQLIARMLPYVQQYEPADAAEIEAQTSIVRAAQRAMSS